MKKLHLLAIIAIVLALAVATPTFADTPKVLTIEAEIGQTISYSGTTEEGVLAVSCGLYDAEDNELQFNSVAALDEAFAGEFTADDTAVLIRCANYDGGAIVEYSLITNAEETPTEAATDDANSPETGASTSLSADAAQKITLFTAVGVAITIAAIFIITRIRTQKTK
ncbi:hypothetical protein IKF73_02020 [Candidatus Saccharibacteria bacterium]|nr:hypothetical protein [Candidatus Saccharibacteria bacterium]